MERYERLIRVIGRDAQERLRRATVMVAGLGGLGSAASLYLAYTGVGRLIIVDRDTVEESNLDRQILYTPRDLGRPKAAAAARRLREANPDVDVVAVEADIAEAAPRLVVEADVVVDALDNWDSRLELNRAAVAAGKPLVHAAVEGLQGQMMVVVPGETACLECVFGGLRGRRGGAVLGPVAGVMGAMEAVEAVKLAAGLGSSMAGRLLVADFSSGSFDVIRVARRPGCPVCGAARDI